MRLFYLVGAVIIFLLVLVLALPQIGGTCTWYFPLATTTNCSFALMQAAGLGAIMGGFLILFWKMPKKSEDDEDEDGDVGGGSSS